MSNSVSSSIKTKNKNNKTTMIGELFLILFVVSAVYFGFLVYQSRLYVNATTSQNNTQAIQIQEKWLSKLPLADFVLNNYLQLYIDNIADSYNKEEQTYQGSLDIIATLKDEEYAEQISDIQNQLSDLQESKNAYYAGLRYLDNNNYISAMTSLKKVSEDDSNCLFAKEKIEEIKEYFTTDIDQRIWNDLYEEKISEASEYAVISGDCLSDEIHQGLKNAAVDCGDPSIYYLSKVLYDNLTVIEKNPESKKSKCTNIDVYKLSAVNYILTSLFDNDSITYYSVSISGSVSSISEDEYMDIMVKNGKTAKLNIPWNADIKNNEKYDSLYEALVEFGPTYEGEKTNLSSVRLTYTQNKEEDEEIRDSKPGFMNLTAVVLLSALTVFICWKMLIGAIKGMFGW